ncbi:MAG: redoxin family protein [Bacteroidota bacterium]
MKQILFICAGLLLVGCAQEVKKDYVTFSGTITDKNSDSVMISSREHKISKTIQVNEDGTFSDTLKVVPGVYRLYDGGESSIMYLENGYDIAMTLDTKEFDETIAYTGVGSENSNFLAEKALLEEKLLDFEIENMTQDDLSAKMNSIDKEVNDFIDSKENLDTAVVSYAKKGIKSMVKSYSGYLGDLIALRTNLPKGAPSPVFSNYENHAGGATSLEELKGKYIYIDVWATWCGPCKAEIPHLKKVEADYHDKNIQFVSVSIDEPKNYDKWVSMVNDKELGGVQVIADNNWQSKWVKDYYIKGIPRFILIDPEGNIISPDAPRPSSPKLRDMFQEIL